MYSKSLVFRQVLGISAATGFAVAGFAPAAQAQTATTVTLDAINVTAARSERPVEDIPQTVQVVERAEIQKALEFSPSASVALSKLVPGYSVANQSISEASESFRGRGLMVMIDGVSLNTPLRNVSRILSMIDLNSVERIEVVAGASSLYGAGATGGTVNFITRKAVEGPPQVTVNTAVRAFTANVGESLTPETSVSIMGKAANGFDYVFAGTARMARKTYDGDGRELPSDGMLGQGGGDRFKSGNALGKLGYDFDMSKRFEVSANFLYLNQDPAWLTNYGGDYAMPNFNSPYTGQSVLEDTKMFSARYTDKSFFAGALNILGFYNDVKKRFNYTEFSFPSNSLVYYSFDPASPTSPNNQTTLMSKRGGVNATIDTPLDKIWSGAKLTWGTDLVREKTRQVLTNGQDVFTPLTQDTFAAFGVLQVPLGERIVVRGGVRYENFALKVDNFDRPAVYYGFPVGAGFVPFILPELSVVGGNFKYDATTFNLGATFKVTDTVELYGGFTQGFALPDVGAFTRRAGTGFAYACAVATPNCLPAGTSVSYNNIGPDAQIVNNYELGLRVHDGAFKANLTAFLSTSKNGVTFDSVTNQISQQREKIYGVEFTGEAMVNAHVTVGTSMTYREGRYDSDNDDSIDSYLPNNRIATPFRATAHATYRFDNDISVRVEGEAFTGRNKAIDLAGTRYKINPGALMNLGLDAPFQGGRAYLAVNNVFDTLYENPTATSVRNLPVYSWGRTITAGYRRTF